MTNILYVKNTHFLIVLYKNFDIVNYLQFNLTCIYYTLYKVSYIN